jgi:hypothetical protein
LIGCHLCFVGGERLIRGLLGFVVAEGLLVESATVEP